MIPKYFLSMSPAFASALGDHLWQSTLFAVVAALLTLTLRKHRAGARYGLWLVASLKFLVPFSLLAGVGSQLAWLRGPAPSTPGLYVAIEEVSRPFTQPSLSAISGSPAGGSPFNLTTVLPVLLAVWFCGFLAVLIVWYAHWRHISAALRDAVPVHEGREFTALRRMEHSAGIRERIAMFLSPASLEPGIFGVLRPVMVWPRGISDRLEDAHLEAILVHELRHVRRRDNLAASIHMVVQAIFWFHPLVWWLGARLVEERERACDEEVLELGGEPQVYAESILKVCEFCVGSPLACVSGVTGADLKKRIVHIMTGKVARKLDFSRKVLLVTAAAAAIAVPVIFGLANATPSRAQSLGSAPEPAAYQVLALKPNNSSGDKHMVRLLFSPERFTAIGVTAQSLIREAYEIQDNQLYGAPEWLNSQAFDLDASLDSSVAEKLKKLSPEQHALVAHRMLQALLADRFKLAVHAETRDLPIYSLVVAEGGPKLKESSAPEIHAGEPMSNEMGGTVRNERRGLMRMGRGDLNGEGLNISDLARLLSQQLGTNVVDKTGLTGTYDFNLHWRADDSQFPILGLQPGPRASGSAPTPQPAGPELLTAIQEQLGLKLEPHQAPVQVVVIDHVEAPAEN